MSRSERDYGLPRLTIEQFAREVDAAPQDVVTWLGKLLYEKVIDHARWSRWTNDTEPIAPALIRLFLLQRPAEGVAPVLVDHPPRPGPSGAAPKQIRRARRG